VEDVVGWLLIAAALGIGAALPHVRVSRYRKHARAILRGHPAMTAATREGESARVSGIVRAIETLAAPVTGRPCVVHRLTIIDMPRGRRHTQVGITPFLLDRGAAGTVRVEGSHAVIDLPSKKVSPPNRASGQRALARFADAWRSNSQLRYEQMLVEPGQRISVAGLVMYDVPDAPTADERGFRDQARPRLRITGNAEHPLAIGRPED
jgi:hypothetical protein